MASGSGRNNRGSGRWPTKPPLSKTHPALAIEADGWNPEEITAGVNKKLPWRCPKGHQYDASPGNRTNGSGCPVCSGRKVLVGFNDLATTHPALAEQVVGGDPRAISSGSAKRLTWQCPQGHTWNAPPTGRVRGEGCPVCAGRLVIAGINDIATTHPEFASQAVGWDPTTLSAGSNRRLLWRCSQGHEWENSPCNRKRGQGCPYCSNQKVLDGYNDLATTHPNLAVEAFGWDPTIVIAGTGKHLDWRCAAGHVWKTTGSDRIRGKGCPYCSNKQVLSGYNDLATTHPHLAAEAHGWNPATKTAGSDAKMRWRCHLGHEWNSTIGSRKLGVGCPYCSNKQVLSGYNDLATTHSHLAAEAHGWNPATKTAGSDAKMRWRCNLGHEWDALVFNRARGVGCPYCSNQKVLKGFNDLAILRPDLAVEMINGDPTTITVSTGRKFRWRCDNGHEWTTSVATRTRGSGCPTCAPYGFSPDRLGWLYLMVHEQWGLLQIGITNVPDIRQSQHERRGWVLMDRIGPMQGHAARELEQRLLTALREDGVITGEESAGGRFSGFTEAWPTEKLRIKSIAELGQALGV